MAKEATKPKKRARPRRKPEDESIYYVVQIDDWEWGFSFGINSMRDRDDPYHDFRHLNLTGKLLRPAKVKANAVRLVLMPDERLNREARQRQVPITVGSLNLHRGQLEALLPIPADVLASLLTMASAEKLRFAVLHGGKLRYGHAGARNFRLEMSIDEDDLPPEN